MIKIFILIFLLTKSLFSELFWDGRYYHQSFFNFSLKSEKVYTEYTGLNILDLKIDDQISEKLRIRSEIEYSILKSKGNFILYLNETEKININTLNATISPENFKITIGRFLPYWSKGKIFKPLDIFKPQFYLLNALSFKGIDALSFKYYPSTLSSLEFIALPSMDVRNILPLSKISVNTNFTNKIEHTVMACNFEFHMSKFDNNLIFLKDTSSDNYSIGFAFKGDAIFGLWSEILYMFNLQNDNAIKISLGADYSIHQKYFFTTEFLYDQTGTDKTEYYRTLRLNPYRMTIGKYYSFFDFNVLSESELNYGISFLQNLMDKSFILFPYLKCEFIQNFISGISIYYFNGQTESEFSPALSGNYLLNLYLVISF